MISQLAAQQLGEDAAFLLAQADPLRAAKIMFRALKLQPSGGRAAVVRWLVEELIRHDPPALRGTLADLQRIAATTGG